MSKFCGNCGTMLPDDANVCGNCGTVLNKPQAPVEPVAPAAPIEPVAPFEPNNPYAAPVQPQAPAQPPVQDKAPGEGFIDKIKKFVVGIIDRMKADKKFMTMVIAIAGGATALIAALIIVLCLLCGGYESAIQNHIDRLTGDYDAYIDAYPESYWDDHNMKDQDEYEDQYHGMFADYYDEDFYIDFEIIDEDEITDSSYSSLKDKLHENWGVSRKDIGDAYIVTVLFATEYDDEDIYNLSTLTVVEIDGDWYVFD